MSLNRVRLLFRTTTALLYPLRSSQVKILPNLAQRFKHYSTFPESNVLPLKADVKMRIQFTCKRCNTRNEKQFSKTAYTNGVVIIRCDGCNNNHLIADNLKWFDDKKTNIETILAEKGLQVNKGVTSFTNIENTDEVVTLKSSSGVTEGDQK